MKRKIVKWILTTLLFVMSALCFVGCNKSDVKFNIQEQYDKGEEQLFQILYDDVNDVTTVSFVGKVYNDTYYDINGFSITVNLYDADGKYVEQATYHLEHEVKHNEVSNPTVERFKVSYEVGRVEYQAWSPSYDSLFQTYLTWFLGLGTGTILLIGVWVWLFFFA